MVSGVTWTVLWNPQGQDRGLTGEMVYELSYMHEKAHSQVSTVQSDGNQDDKKTKDIRLSLLDEGHASSITFGHQSSDSRV